MGTVEQEVGRKRRVFLVGATGYIGRHTLHALQARGHDVICFARPRAGVDSRDDETTTVRKLDGAEVRFGDVSNGDSIARDGMRGERFDAIVSCLASRTGAPDDAWKIDHQANVNVLEAGRAAGASHLVLLSAICVQKPLLAFQHAKLAFEKTLVESGLTYSIVRPTAFFKSLSGQIARIKRGKPFVMFGDGTLTACKPIGEGDLGRYLADCLEDPSKQNAILPVGGPGEAMTPKAQGELLFEIAGLPPRFRQVPVALLDAIIAGTSALGVIVPSLRAKSELARIGRYYATESMLVLDPTTGRYDAAATPSYGQETLRSFYTRAFRDGPAGQELGDHAVF